jgi:hypothetical protein
VFGCIAHVRVARLNLKKLDDRSTPMIFVGYEPGSATCRCYNLNTKSAHEAGGVSVQARDEEHVATPPKILGTPVGGGGISPRSGPIEQGRTPPSCNLDADHDDAHLRYRRLSDILGPVTPPGKANREVQGGLYFEAREEPTSFSQVELKASWGHAMQEEIRSIEENQTWKLVDLPQGHRLIGLKWVHKLKKNATGGL